MGVTLRGKRNGRRFQAVEDEGARHIASTRESIHQQQSRNLRGLQSGGQRKHGSNAARFAMSASVMAMLIIVYPCLRIIGGASFGPRAALDATPTNATGFGDGSTPCMTTDDFRAKAMAGTVPRLPLPGEPAGIVFDASPGADDGGGLSAAGLLASAGLPVRVHDNAGAIQEAIHRCRATGCTAADSSEKIRWEYAGLLLLPAGDKESSREARAFEGQGEHGERRPKGEGLQCMGREGDIVSAGSTDAREIAARLREGIAAGDTETALAGGQGGRFEGKDGKAQREGEGVGSGTGGGGGGGLYFGWGGFSEEEEEAEETWSVLVLSGWSTDDMQALLEAFPETPWLLVYDDTSGSCHQGSSAEAVLTLVSNSASSGGKPRGVILASSWLGPGATARVLARHFGVRLPSMGELRMAKHHAVNVLSGVRGSEEQYEELSESRSEDRPTSDNTAVFFARKEDADERRCETSVSGMPTEAFLRLKEVSRESAKVLGGSFDTDWWWGPATRITAQQDDARSSCLGPPARSAADDFIAKEDDPQEQTCVDVEEGQTRIDGDGATSRGDGKAIGEGLRRMVDGESPLWMSSEVYSEPVESFPCPDRPAPGYPLEWPLADVLSNWNPGNASGIPLTYFLGVCRFDYQRELHKTQAYGLAEVPFIVYNVPALDRAVLEWSDPMKLSSALGDKQYSIDVSSSNRFLYYGKKSVDRPPGWTPPTWRMSGTFDSWLRQALRDTAVDQGNEESQENDGVNTGDRHTDLDSGSDQSPSDTDVSVCSDHNNYYYFKVSSTETKTNSFLERSLPFFVPAVPQVSLDEDSIDHQHTDFPESFSFGGKTGRAKNRWDERRKYIKDEVGEDSDGGSTWNDNEADVGGGGMEDVEHTDIFLREPSASKGIHCRIGMDGVMSEAHYDGSRNMVALLAGKRRWILSKPQNCDKLHMFRKGHPSERHTSADWTDPDVVSRFPRLTEATANEVILRAGEALYVPEHWIHSIVNIGVSAQCNSRSGRSRMYKETISNCEERADGE